MRNALKRLDFTYGFSANRVHSYGAQYIAFGIFSVANYILPYFMWSYTEHDDYVSLSLRFVAGLLSFFLIMNDYWPKSFRKLLPLYWHITLLFCLPFMTTYMLLSTHASIYWLLNMSLALFLLALLVDWLSFTIILPLGVLLGYGLYWIMGGTSTIELRSEAFFLSVYMSIFAILIAIIFSRNRERAERDKILAIKALSATIAHEIRTPLSAITFGAKGMKKHLPKIIEGYELALDNNLPVRDIEKMNYDALKDMPESLSIVSRNANTIIDMLLMKLKEHPVEENLKVCSVGQCVQDLLENYPMFSSDKKLIHWNKENDFQFMGNQVLMRHVLFNLLKNAIYFVKSAGRGRISIWFEQSDIQNKLHFRDTGKGISTSDLPNIFDRFYTTTKHGTGIGLAFCKLTIQGFGGDIVCHSIEGKYTEFVMKFPKIHPQKNVISK